MSTLAADYVVVGGGLTGCVVASRLKQNEPSLNIIVLEAGPDPESKHDVTSPMGGFALQGSELDWQYPTKPDSSTQHRVHTLTAGKTLGGGSILNYAGWSRGDAADYDTWSRLSGYKQWDYASLLPYFQRSERFGPTEKPPPDISQRGLHGPMKITSVNVSSPKRRYPLGDPLCNAWRELGVDMAYGCTGRNEGLSEWLENWDNGQRQAAHQAYPLNDIQVLTGTPVSGILLAEVLGGSTSTATTQPPRATGVLLQDGRRVQAHREVLLCAGALRSPAILMASGIGPRTSLSERHVPIPVVQDLPGVGANMIDHFALFQLFKLRPSDKGLALGHPDLDDPAFFLGLPADHVANQGLPRNLLEKALDEDGITGAERDALLEPGRCFLEFLVMYHPLSAPVPADGTYVSTSVMLTLPSSRGSVSLGYGPQALPDIEPGYFTTALDRLALVHGVRRMLQLMLATKALQPYVETEVPPPGHSLLYPDSSDAEIEARIRAAGVAHFHTTGTCALGSVVDADMSVRGVNGLRVCDGSVLPSPVGGHPQATLYGIAEKAAELISHQPKHE
ncbi:MAG: hypothetical protein Q9181_000425 [Wetmoreana brouardii]